MPIEGLGAQYPAGDSAMWTEPRTNSSGAKGLLNRPSEIGKRREQRIRVSIPVRVSGVDRDGNPFTQTAQTVDVSHHGARISGIHCLREPGEMVTVECGPRIAYFIVVWIGQPGTAEEGQFGMKALDPEKRIFRIETGESKPEGNAKPSAQPPSDPFASQPLSAGSQDHGERRSAPRIPCAGTGQIQQKGVAFPTWAEVSDLSSGGCYVQMVFTIPRGSVVDVQLTINTRSFAALGEVVTSHPGVGMGIKFIELTPENQKTLSEILQELTAK